MRQSLLSGRSGWPPALLCLLDQLLAEADRTDPLDETVLCLVEAAALAATAAQRARVGAEPDVALAEALAAARAAVLAARYAVTAARC